MKAWNELSDEEKKQAFAWVREFIKDSISNTTIKIALSRCKLERRPDYYLFDGFNKALRDVIDEQQVEQQRTEMRKHNQGVLDLAARLYHYRELPEYKALVEYVDEWLEDSDVGELMNDLRVAADKYLHESVRAYLAKEV